MLTGLFPSQLWPIHPRLSNNSTCPCCIHYGFSWEVWERHDFSECVGHTSDNSMNSVFITFGLNWGCTHGGEQLGISNTSSSVAVGPSLSHFEKGRGLIMCTVRVWCIFTSLDVNCEITVQHLLYFIRSCGQIGSFVVVQKMGHFRLSFLYSCCIKCAFFMNFYCSNVYTVLLFKQLWNSLHNLTFAFPDYNSHVVQCENC